MSEHVTETEKPCVRGCTIARRHAEEILEADPGLHRHPALAERVRRLAGSEESDYLFRY